MGDSESIVADVVVVATPAEELANRTLIKAMEREGWRAIRGAGAGCVVIVWSQTNVSRQ